MKILEFMVRRLFEVLIAIIVLPAMTWAEPVQYTVDVDASDVAFEYMFGEQVVAGQFPAFTSDVIIDFDNARKSSVSVSLDAREAVAGFVFATQAMRGPQILNAEEFPNVHFQSSTVEPTAEGALIHGVINIRGVALPLTLNARLFRPAGSSADNRDSLKLVLTGSLSRKAFGADGYADMVGDTLTLIITVQIERAG